MYPDIGTIHLYTVLNLAARVIVFLFNILDFKSKTGVVGRGTEYFTKKPNKSKKSDMSLTKVILILGEIIIISFAQYIFSGINGMVGTLLGTGANYFGKLFFAPIVVAFFCLLLGIDVFRQIDIITPAMPLALVVSKMACFFQGCCGGIECSFGLYNHSTERVEFPVQLVEAFFALAIFVFLLIWRKKAKEGTVYPVYIILYSATRFFSEFLRSDENYFLILKKYHILCLVGIAVGFLLLYVVKNHKERIRHFYEVFFDAMEEALDEIKIRMGIKREQEIVHHKNRKKSNADTFKKQNKKIRTSNMKKWIIIWTIGLIGQIGWNIEGTWFNTFVYEKIDKTPSIITPMLILSAFATTVSVFLFGTLTDRTGKRRTLVSSGFVAWGILFICFGATQYIAKINLTAGIITIVVMDMVLSFLGSISTDVGYSTWLTDIMNNNNRGQIGGAMAIQTVLGSLLGNIIGGYIVGTENNYLRLFISMGSLFAIFGLISIFLFDKKDDAKPFINGSYTEQLASIFNFKDLFKNKEFIWINLAVAIYFTGYNIYFPHVGNVLTQYLGYSATQMGVIKAVPIIFAMLITVPASKLINKNKFIEVVLISVSVGLIGNLSCYNMTPEDVDISSAFNFRIFLNVFCIGISYIIMFQATKTWTKKLHPHGRKGQFEVLWAISFALIPAFFGSYIGEWIVKYSGESMFNKYTGRFEHIPNGKILLIGAIVSAFSIIPIIIAKKYADKKNSIEEKETV